MGNSSSSSATTSPIPDPDTVNTDIEVQKPTRKHTHSQLEDEEKKSGSTTGDEEKNLNVDNLTPQQALSYAIDQGDLELIRRIYNVDPTAINTPDNGDASFVDIIDKKAAEKEKEEKDKESLYRDLVITGDYPIHKAVESNRLPVLELLFFLSADLESPNRVGSTALHRACSLNRPIIVSFLLSKGAKFDAVNGIFNTPLHIASYGGYSEVADLLLQQARLKSVTEATRLAERMNGAGMTPIDYARKRNMRELLEPYKRCKTGYMGILAGGHRTASNSEKKLDGLMGHSFSSAEEDEDAEAEQQLSVAAAIQAAISSASASATRKKLVGLNLSGIASGGGKEGALSPKSLDTAKGRGGSSSRRKGKSEREMKDVTFE